MAHYLGVGVAMITTGLSPDVIVLVGEVTRVWKQIGPVIESVVKECSGAVARPRIIPVGPETRLRGAVALFAQRHFGALHAI
jgi:predicted NBD/HSP70 family sugar kinase